MSAVVTPARLALAVLCLGLVISGWAAPRAPAAFPGQNGKIAFTSNRDLTGAIHAMNPDGSSPTNLTNDAAGTASGSPAWSADGQQIAFTRVASGDLEVYGMDANGSAQTNLTNNAADADYAPAWSPDGQQIAFTSLRDGNNEIYMMNANGSAQTRLTNNLADDSFPAWSPDGQKIAFTSSRDGNEEIYTMNPNGGSPTNLTNLTNNAAVDREVAWSPDGQKIAFTSTRDGNEEIYTMNANGSSPTNLTNNAAGDEKPAWSPDGQRIAFVSFRDGTSEIYSMNANGSAQTRLTNNTADDSEPDWQPLDPDADGDALPDSWEIDGIDVDGDGTIDLDLPAMGADPDHKDIFIEVDFMAGHRIDDAQIDAVTKAFKDAPVPNPDNTTGITLHVDNGSGSTMDPVSGSTWGSLSDQDSLPHQDVLGTDFTTGGQREYDWSQFESIRQTKLLAIRRPAFHYVIAAHSGPSQRFSGISRGVHGGAADFVMAMHEVCPVVPQPLASECAPDPERTSTVFMHEFGHNLGLQHGGTDEDAHKPNYLSVMNYNFGFGLIVFDGVTPTSTTLELDYSRYNVPLNENRLNEQTGFGIDTGPVTAYKTIFACPNGKKYTIPFTTEQIDWNCDRTILGSTGNVSSDASGNGTISQLASPIDWNRLTFSGGGIGGLSAAPGPDSTVIDEPTPAELQRNRNVLEHGSAPPIDPAQPKPPVESKPDNEFSFGKAKKNKRKGTAKLTVNVPGPGALELAAAKTVKGDEAEAEAAGEVTLIVKPKGKAKKKLKKRGKAKVSAEVTYTPTGGTPNTQSTNIKLAKKRR